MKDKLILTFVCVLSAIASFGQKPFREGSIRYKVVFENSEHKTFTGFYIFTIKDGQIRKDLTLSNGFQNIELINTNNNIIYTLRANKNGKKFAIQLSMDELTERQQKYKGFILQPQAGKDKEIAGITAEKGKLQYNDGSSKEIFYSDKWYLEPGISYERFPDARFLPLAYDFSDDTRGFVMHMEAIEVSIKPVENAIFRLPPDHRLITNEEYKEISKQ